MPYGAPEPSKKEKPKGKLAMKLVEAYGNPYMVEKAGDKFKVVGIKDHKTHGTYDSRDKAMKQFRLLEALYHGELKRKK